MKIGHGITLIVCSFFVFLAGCSSHRACGSTDWVIEVGSGGGITGGSNGYTIESNGKVSAWQIVQASSEKTTKPLFEIACDSVEFYKTYLDLMRFDTINFSKVGNWTSFVELRQGEVAHRVSWTGDSGPLHVESFHDLLVGFITSRVKR